MVMFCAAVLCNCVGLGVLLVPTTKELNHLEEGGVQEVVEVLRWSCHAIDRFWRSLYGNGVWLDREQAQTLVRDGWAFIVAGLCPLSLFFGGIPASWLRSPRALVFRGLGLVTPPSLPGKDGYATLAKIGCRLGVAGFHVRPKLHMFCHLL